MIGGGLWIYLDGSKISDDQWMTLEDVEKLCRDTAGADYDIRLLQSNHEGQIVDWIHEAREKAAGESR